MKKSDLIKNSLDKKYEQFLEEYKYLFYLLIGLILAFVAYLTTNINNLDKNIETVFFSLIILDIYVMNLMRNRLDKVRKNIRKIKLQ